MKIARSEKRITALYVLCGMCITALPIDNALSQTQLAAVAGIAVDSVHGGYLQDAVVKVSGQNRSATTDSLGRFRIDSIQPGLHTLRLIHALLDTVGVAVTTAPTMIQAGESKSFVLAIPSRLTIVAHKCSASEMERGRAALAGSVVDADSQDPSVGASVVVAWTDIQVGTKTITRTPQRRTGKVMNDGSYLICGIPDDLATNVTAVRGTDSTGSIAIAFNRFLALQSFSMPVALSDSSGLSKQSSNHVARAVLKGKITGPDNKPLSGARVSVEDDSAATNSDASGLFTLTGARPGTRELTVRKIGFEPVETPVELSSIHSRDVVVQLKNTVKVLEAVRISALREVGLERVGFADRKRSAFGKFYSPRAAEPLLFH